ncbi:MAG TPA: hypothetical protein VGK70_08600 [Thermoanaerobaculia bacterium]|jgi:hypothetical protein
MIRSSRKLDGEYNNTEVYDDDLYHFFQDVWHLKDWLKNDPAVSQQVRTSVETDVNGVQALRLAADLANGSKHFELRFPREGAAIKQRHVIVKLGEQKGAEQRRDVSTTGGSSTTAEQIARDSIKEWEKLLIAYRLQLPPTP